MSELIIKSTIKVVLTFIYPPPAVITLVPIISFVFRPTKSNEPASDENIEEAMSGSLASWEKVKIISAVVSHCKVLRSILTDGVKSIHGWSPVRPPTQLPQLSRKALPFGVL